MTLALKDDPFATVAEHNHLHFYDRKSKYPKKVVEFLRLSQEEVAKATDIAKTNVRYDSRMPPELEERLMEIGNICELVAARFKGDPQKTALWFQTPNPLLGNISPRDMIRFGRYRKLLKFITNAIAGNMP